VAELATFATLAEGNFHARLSRVEGLAVVLFSAPQCGACRAWKALLPRALGESGIQFFEVDVAQATGIARYYDIFHLPTIYLFRDGRFHAELQAEARIESVRAAAEALLAAPAQEEP
jgi:thioredoxin-like negative regulator of GroEL